MSEARMTSKGQITVPKAVRVRLNLKPGDRVLFIVEDDGTARLRAVNKRHLVAEGSPAAAETQGNDRGDRRSHRAGRGRRRTRP